MTLSQLNPLKALCNLFGKWIIEHGSADIQTKHIALLKEQLSICNQKTLDLEKQVSILQSAQNQLQTENNNLRLKINNSHELNEQLKQKLSQCKAMLAAATLHNQNPPDDDEPKRSWINYKK